MVIPMHNAGDDLKQCLESLQRSEAQPSECIVVDDGSTDGSAKLAAEYGAKVLSTQGRYGPARARNIGAIAAEGDIVLFLDADVCVHPDTIPKVMAAFADDPELDAVMGSYDELPSATNFVSRYRNLMHSFVHQSSNREATTFWSGCGAIRRQVFLDAGGFDDQHYHAPAIEDVELGYRLKKANRKLALGPDIQVKHLKRWYLRGMIETDFFRRAIPWSELALRSGRMPNDLNLRISQRISVALAFIIVALGAYGALRWHVYFLTPLFAIFFILLSAYWIDISENRSRVVMPLMFVVMGLIVVFSYRFQMYAIIPLVLVAWLALFTRHRYAYSREKWRRWTGLLVGGYCLLVIGWMAVYLPRSPLKFVFYVLLMTLVVLNKQFYLFLAGREGKFFALAAIPFHLLYFVYSGVGFMVAMFRHGLSKFYPAEAVLPTAPAAGEDKAKAAAP
ncbi:MAG TPA: glycosyltransferase [Terriglobia bacterium]|nr:glycosyltransferase [Terriglobia bacterium]